MYELHRVAKPFRREIGFALLSTLLSVSILLTVALLQTQITTLTSLHLASEQHTSNRSEARRVAISLAATSIVVARAGRETAPHQLPFEAMGQDWSAITRNSGGLLDLNTARADLLQTLLATEGESADALLNHRTQIARLTSIDDLQIYGLLSDEAFYALRDHLTV